MADDTKKSLLEFPCEFPIKMMGRASDRFQDTAVAIVEKHVGKIADDAIAIAPSRKGSFVSITVTIFAQSQQQLDGIYRELTEHEDILVAL